MPHPAQAQGITITVIPALAPNVYGSPNWTAWVSNATTAIANGYAAYGDPSSPSYYQWAPSVISVTNDIVTGFPSWDGLADPGDVFGVNFSQELGNRLQFGIDIKGGTNLISISQLSFSAHSTDPSNTLDFAFAQGSYNYSPPTLASFMVLAAPIPASPAARPRNWSMKSSVAVPAMPGRFMIRPVTLPASKATSWCLRFTDQQPALHFHGNLHD